MTLAFTLLPLVHNLVADAKILMLHALWYDSDTMVSLYVIVVVCESAA
jgi:hypothetical protein